MSTLLLSPILIPLCAATISLIAWRFATAQRVLAVIGTGLHLIVSVLLLRAVAGHGIQAAQVGGWVAPYGITVVADVFSAIMATLAGLIGCSVAIYSLALTKESHVGFGFYPFFHVLLAGVSGAFLAGDIFNLYVWFEVMLISSFVLMALGGGVAQIEGAIKYVALNILSSAFFLAAVGILYGITGTLNMADLSVKLSLAGPSPLVTTVAMLFVAAFGIKAAVFPLFFWLPASYHTAPAPVAAVFAGLLTKVGVYALIRVFTLLFTAETGVTHALILIVSGLTMITGVLGAIIQTDFRRILSFHIISQIGYMIMGLGLYTPLALAGSVFYIVHHVIVKANLFLVAGVVYRLRGSSDVRKLGGLYRDDPLWAGLFLVPALSLAGLPPLSGFFAKLTLAKAGLAAGEFVIVATALLVGLLTLLSMTKIFNEVFWKPAPDDRPNADNSSAALTWPIGLLAGLTVILGLWTGPAFDLAKQASAQLMDKSAYIAAVLGERR